MSKVTSPRDKGNSALRPSVTWEHPKRCLPIYLAAVGTLRAHPEVDPEAGGLWGRSEGGWLVPLAATAQRRWPSSSWSEPPASRQHDRCPGFWRASSAT
jgi:hypothetical protein